MLLFQKIEDLAYTHTDAKRTIGEFLLTEKSGVQKYSMQEIADRTFTSKSSLVRFAKCLGFSGWKEFMEAFLGETYYEESRYTDIDPNFPFTKNDSAEVVSAQLSSLMVESILDTTEQLDMNELERAVDILLRAENIGIFSMSPNSYVASLFRRKMLTIGRNILIPTGTDLGLLASSMKHGDCAILISYTGNNPERIPMRFLPVFHENNVSVIAITGLGDNLLRREADCVLSMSSRERMYSKISTFSTEESINFILNMLFARYFQRNYDLNLQYKIKASKHFESRRYSAYSDIREEDDNRII